MVRQYDDLLKSAKRPLSFFMAYYIRWKFLVKLRYLKKCLQCKRFLVINSIIRCFYRLNVYFFRYNKFFVGSYFYCYRYFFFLIKIRLVDLVYEVCKYIFFCCRNYISFFDIKKYL